MGLIEKIKAKRGDISVIILVIGVFVICTLALLSFISSTIKVRESFIGVSVLDRANLEIEKNSLDNYLDKKTTTEGFLFWQEEVVLFSVEYKKPS